MVEPTGILNKALLNLRNLIAACPSWQTWMEAEGDDAAKLAAAKAAIQLVMKTCPDDGDWAAIRPICMVRDTAPASWEFSSLLGDTGCSGTLELTFEDNIDEANLDDPKDAMFAFMNQVEAVVKEAMARQGDDEYLIVRKIRSKEGPGLSHPDEKESHGSYVGVILAVDWGVSE